MRRPILRWLSLAAMVLVLVMATTTIALAQRRPEQRTPPPQAPAPPAAPAAPAITQEIKLDESTTLKAVAVEARMSAILANFALLQRQAQDLQQDMARLLEERKKLIEGAGQQANVEVADSNEWAFDNKGQRYLRVRQGKP